MSRFVPILVLISTLAFSQENKADSAKNLEEVVVRGFETERRLIETSASVSVLNIKDIQRFENQTFVPVLNTISGVRMEERSPGSYRLSIRGSSIRSPFGVRNVKVYWNDIPLNDGNGNTFLNAIDMNSIGNLEIIKGPAGSIYGAGTGGVLIMQGSKATGQQGNEATRQQGNEQTTEEVNKETSKQGNNQTGKQGNKLTSQPTNSITTALSFGSFGLQNRSFSYSSATEKSNSVITYAHAQTNGYREHSGMVRDFLNLRSSLFLTDAKTINITGVYSDMHYNTPGGLTQAQMDKDPSAARPSTATVAGPVAQKAGIYQKLFNLGLSQEYRWNNRWSNVTALYGMFSNLRNPFITNYEIRDEQTFGGRSRTTYKFDLGKIQNRINFGGEFQRSAWVIRNFGNKAGVIDTLQTNDNLYIWQYFLFGQLESELPHDIILTLGGSYNRMYYDFLRVSDAPKLYPIQQWLPTAFSPRVALLKKIKNQFSVFGSVGSGFSPPTMTEYITGYRFNTYTASLSSEKGVNYEIGTRGSLLKNRLTFDITAYSFRLKNTIVRSVDAAGRELFTNAGNTLQNGLELMFNGFIITPADDTFFSQIRAFSSLTFNDYTFETYKVLKSDYSGNQFTGVPKKVMVAGIDAETKIGFYLNSTFNFTDKMPLNDANTVFANSYRLLNAKVGYRQDFGRIGLNIYLGGDNLLNELYSLGNDTNAVGNRFFNPAPTRNWYGGGNLKFYF